jgi:uncharacterized damage-inducible protein DinB
MSTEVQEYVTVLRREGQVLGDAAAQASLDAPVVACPGWNVADLLWHIGEVHDFWGRVVAHTTDADGEWLVTEADDRLQVSHGHTKADAAARGSAADLLLLLWRRIHRPIDVHGDQAVLDRLVARTNLD